MTGVMASSSPAPRVSLRKPLRCRWPFRRHHIVGRFWYIEGSPWKTRIRYCQDCGQIEDAHAKKHGTP